MQRQYTFPQDTGRNALSLTPTEAPRVRHGSYFPLNLSVLNCLIQVMVVIMWCRLLLRHTLTYMQSHTNIVHFTSGTPASHSFAASENQVNFRLDFFYFFLKTPPFPCSSRRLLSVIPRFIKHASQPESILQGRWGKKTKHASSSICFTCIHLEVNSNRSQKALIKITVLTSAP